MRIGFFGTPAIAAYCLDYLAERHDILFAVTNEDKKSGRSQHLSFSPVKEKAISRNIPLLQPVSLKDPAFSLELDKYPAELYVIVAYGHIIPRSIFDRPEFKTINLHPSLLPKYRGAAPVEWAIISGEAESGITVQLINERLDAGDIILSTGLDIPGDITAGGLYEIVLPEGARLLDRAINLIASGKASPAKQDESQATYCGKIDRDTARIDWSQGAISISNLVRGLNPKPGAWTSFRGKNVKIWSAFPAESGPSLAPGQITIHQKRLFAGTGSGILEIKLLQQETKKSMDGPAFANGARLQPSDRFE